MILKRTIYSVEHKIIYYVQRYYAISIYPNLWTELYEKSVVNQRIDDIFDGYAASFCMSYQYQEVKSGDWLTLNSTWQ